MRKRRFFFQLIAIIFAIGLYLPILQAEDHPPININTALSEELMQLKGIGPKKATAITEYREKHGPFKMPEDLMKVPGIGPKTFEANKNRITVNVE